MNEIFASPLYLSLLFLGTNAIILPLILILNHQVPTKSEPPSPSSESGSALEKPLVATDILGWEFTYAQTTASEALRDRHTMINFYLLAVGVIFSGVLTIRGTDSALPAVTSTILLWLLCLIGWIYFLMLIRLRQAWCDSIQTMNHIKQFYIDHACDLKSDVLAGAFRWHARSMPRPEKPWTVFFYSAVLIGLLDSLAFVAGGILLDITAILSSSQIFIGVVGLGVAFFVLHIALYFAFLRTGP